MFTVRVIHVSLEVWGSLFCIIAAICMVIGNDIHQKTARILMAIELSNALLLIMDALAWYYRGYEGQIGYWMVRISNMSVFILDDIEMILYHAYVCTQLFRENKKKQKYPRRVYMVFGIMTIAIALVIVNGFNRMYYYFDIHNFYHRNTWFPVSLILGFLCGIIDLTMLIQYRKNLSKEKWTALISYIILPMLATVVLIFFYGISLINIAMTISVLFMHITAVADQSRKLRQQEKEMYDMHVAVMLSQIGPHFIFNTLSTIKHLCKRDPQLAAETVDAFAGYLRGNIDSLTKSEKIPFTRELDHVKQYLTVEKTRFGDKIHVSYDIKEEQFMIPVLTLQPLVENAVKHGILRKLDGGNICIRSYKKEDGYVVEIQDDGIGFDPQKKIEDGKTHVGLDNVITRVQDIQNGKVDIESHLGEGTKITVWIPQK